MTSATALHNGLAVVTRNVRVFSRLGEKAFDPYLVEEPPEGADLDEEPLPALRHVRAAADDEV